MEVAEPSSVEVAEPSSVEVAEPSSVEVAEPSSVEVVVEVAVAEPSSEEEVVVVQKYFARSHQELAFLMQYPVSLRIHHKKQRLTEVKFHTVHTVILTFIEALPISSSKPAHCTNRCAIWTTTIQAIFTFYVLIGPSDRPNQKIECSFKSRFCISQNPALRR